MDMDRRQQTVLVLFLSCSSCSLSLFFGGGRQAGRQAGFLFDQSLILILQQVSDFAVITERCNFLGDLNISWGCFGVICTESPALLDSQYA
jgi:hypothetical protein